MARTGIEEKDVFKAANELIEAGQEPTLQAIREKLGSGSLSTISAHLKKWREQKLRESPVPELPDALVAALKQIWAAAYREATSQFESARASWESERKKLAEENQHLLSEIEKLEKDLAQEQSGRKEVESRIEGAGKEKAQLEEQIQKSRENLVASQAKLEAHEDRLKEALGRGERLERELADIAKMQAQKPKDQ